VKQKQAPLKVRWYKNDGAYEAHFNGSWGFVEPDGRNWYRAYDGRFPRNEFGTGFLGLFATEFQAQQAIEKAWGVFHD